MKPKFTTALIGAIVAGALRLELALDLRTQATTPLGWLRPLHQICWAATNKLK